MNFLTAEYRTKNIFPSSKVISSPLARQLQNKEGKVLCKRYITVFWGSYYSAKDGFIHIWFLNHLFIP